MNAQNPIRMAMESLKPQEDSSGRVFNQQHPGAHEPPRRQDDEAHSWIQQAAFPGESAKPILISNKTIKPNERKENKQCRT